MTTRKQKTSVGKRARHRPAKRSATKRPPTTARRETPAAASPRRRARADGSLVLGAECTVVVADTLKSELARRLDESEPVIVDISAVQRIDTAGLQLLAAFVRDRRTAGRAVGWRGRAAALETAAGILGLHDMLELPGEASR